MKIRPAGIDDMERLVQLRLDYFQASELPENQALSDRRSISEEGRLVRESLKKYFRRQGVATSLMRRLLREARRMKISGIDLLPRRPEKNFIVSWALLKIPSITTYNSGWTDNA